MVYFVINVNVVCVKSLVSIVYVLACVCRLLIFLCAPIKVILHKTSCVPLVLFKVRLAARFQFQPLSQFVTIPRKCICTF